MKTEELLELLKSIGIQQLRIRGQNIVGRCSNHKDRTPSWNISLDAPHVHNCFSCGYRGTLRTLLLDHEYSWQQIVDLLGDTDRPDKLPVLVDPPELPTMPDESELWPFILTTPAIRYMRTRGILYSTLRAAHVVYHPLDRRVLFPWFLGPVYYGATGRTIDPEEPLKIISYGGLQKGKLWYCPTGRQEFNENIMVMVEGEIDALSVYQAGYHGVIALGHGNLSAFQATMLESLPVNLTFVLMFDDDDAGHRLTELVSQKLRQQGRQKIRVVNWGSIKHEGKLDPGMLKVDQIRRVVSKAKLIENWTLK